MPRIAGVRTPYPRETVEAERRQRQQQTAQTQAAASDDSRRAERQRRRPPVEFGKGGNVDTRA
ncbi:MAG: hypothetical protein HYU88_06630 [Chloroflexi bacterium]|nr:hypothetical protein [Chloroflexota bacterium]MBI4506047.1 hypothetical protein [Chloroflexota bacterium]